MKTSILRVGKKSLSVIIALVMILSMTLVGVVNVNAVGAVNSVFSAGDKIYYDFSATTATACNYSGNNWQWEYASSIPDNGIIEVQLTSELNLNNHINHSLCKTNVDNWAYTINLTTLPQDGQNMVKVSADAKSYVWATYDGSTGGGTNSTVYKLHGNYNGVYSWNTPVDSATTATEVTEDGTYKFEINSAGSGNDAKGNAWFRVFADSVEYTTTSGSDTSIADSSSENPLSSKTGSNGAFFFTPVSGQTYYVCVKATSENDPTPLVWLESGSVTPIEKSYYIGGRFRIKNSLGEYIYTYTDSDSYAWDVDSQTMQLTDSDGDGIYTLNTYSTLAELSETVTLDYSGTQQQVPNYFMIHTGNGNTDEWYGKTGAEFTDSTTSVVLDVLSAGASTDNNNGLVRFNSSSSSGNVVIKYVPATHTLSYEIDSSQSTTGQYTITDNSVSGTVSLTAKADGKAENTADAEDTVTVTAVPSKDFFVCTGIKVEADDESEITANGSGNTYTFTMPAQNVTITASYAYNKAAYITSSGNGLWIDVNPSAADSVSTLIKWNNYYGAKHAATNPYTFYLPKNASLNGAVVYNGFDSAVNVAGTEIQPNSSAAVNLVIGDNTVSGPYNGNVKVMQGSTDAMFLYTTDGNRSLQLICTQTHALPALRMT